MRHARLLGLLIMTLPTAAIADKQLDLWCPPELTNYCGGWTVKAFQLNDHCGNISEHIDVNERFVIGRKGNQPANQIWLYPRDGMSDSDRWGKKVRLEWITDEDGNSCLFGSVELLHLDHAGQRPHTIILKSRIDSGTGPSSNAEIGSERVLEMHLIGAPGASRGRRPATPSCTPHKENDSCGVSDHAGVAHVED